ncbi:MAG: methyltransferase domain-containing protein [Rhodospirillales bacterium]|nr:methyltransferase domain-containing protein [Rhodospirillales bacterium]MBO6787716.1 methyltransferase domain-containing protein [Rhodospirillales bacterium]
MDSEPTGAQSIEARLAHWDKTYQNYELPNYPSQFAVFVCDYLDNKQNIIEFGCGSGRDALFFAGLGFKVSGFDGSKVGIERCIGNTPDDVSSRPAFKHLRIDGDWSGEQLAEISAGIRSSLDTSQRTLVYARFFLQSITKEEQQNFLDLLLALDVRNMMCAFEFRTLRDEGQSKITQPHYRRFIDSLQLLKEMDSRGFNIEYFVEGFGLAKFKTEDAHVARVVFTSPEQG